MQGISIVWCRQRPGGGYRPGRVLALAGGLALLAGCAGLGGPEYQRPEVASKDSWSQPAGVTVSATDTIQPDWWTGFGRRTIANRNLALELLDRPRLWDETRFQRYRRHSDPATAGSPGVVPLEELLTDLQRSQEALLAGLAAATEELLTRPSGDETVGLALLGLAWHEAYHAGQTDYLRRLAGKSEGGVR